MDLQENRRRKIALCVFGVLLLIFILLSGASFSSSRERPDPETIRFQGQTAVDGKRVFRPTTAWAATQSSGTVHISLQT